MSRVELVNIVKKITQLSQKDKADFVRILEQALEGGGGDTSKFISVEPQDLTEEQKMQVRKNQGLYYSEGGGEDITLAWDGDTTGLETIGVLYKLSEDVPPASEVKSISLIQNGVEQTYEAGVSPAQITELEGGYAIGDLGCLVITADEVMVQGTTYTKGVWFVYGNENNRTSKIVYGQTETIHHIEPKYIKDMYYEETIEGEKTVITPDDPNYEWQYPDNYWFYGGIDFGWISEDTPTQEDIVSIKFTDSEDYISGSELSSTIIEPEETEGGSIILYEVNNSDSARKKFLVVTDDAFLGGWELKKGIYVPKLETYEDPYISEINYNATTTIVHQIPDKYIPATPTGIQTYDINIDWDELNTIITRGYGYYWHVDNPEEEYDKLYEALGNGKMIALNIGSGAYGYPGGKFLTGNYLPLNRENEDGYISEIIFPVIDWPTYNPNTGTITGSASYIIKLKFGYGLETEEFKFEFVADIVN